MKKIILLLLSCFVFSQSNAQNCSGTSTGLPPLGDLGTGYWQGSQGGLYPGGLNFMPAGHHAAGMNIAQNILPRDMNGNVDLVNGKIVWLSIGMSNTTQETQYFIPMTDTFVLKNPKLILVDGAQGGQDINQIINPNANFWSVINQRLTAAGVTAEQVQVVWFKEAEAQPSDTSFITYPDSLKRKFIKALQIEKFYFPNTRLAYLSNRIYAGYATTGLNPEPFAWYSGWSVKRLIEDQINGDTSLSYTGISARVPWVAWGPDLWADGTTPRSDGLTWICPDDYNSDGTHPSPSGRQKVANLLFDFFSSDSTTTPWFLAQSTTGSNSNQLSSAAAPVLLYDHGARQIRVQWIGKRFGFDIYDIAGRKLDEVRNAFSSIVISTAGYPDGVSILRLSSDNFHFNQKIFIGN